MKLKKKKRVPKGRGKEIFLPMNRREGAGNIGPKKAGCCTLEKNP